MAGPEEEIWGNCLQMHKGVRLWGFRVEPGSYLEEPRKRLVRLGLHPMARRLPKGRSSSGGVMLSSQRCGRGCCKESTHVQACLCTYIQALQANTHMRIF